MALEYNIYCDESCHLENDNQQVMVLGGVWCPYDKVTEIASRIKEIKLEFGYTQNFEIKWTKVSIGKVEFYKKIIDYFFDDDDLHFRVLIIPDKALLRHTDFGQSHDDWYYKMYFDMLKVILKPNAIYNIYLDIKESHSGYKITKLDEVLRNNMYDFSRKILKKVQVIRSHEVQIIQITDLLIGLISYINRGLSSNTGKIKLIERVKERSGYKLTSTTLLKEEKFNIFRWRAR